MSSRLIEAGGIVALVAAGFVADHTRPGATKSVVKELAAGSAPLTSPVREDMVRGLDIPGEHIMAILKRDTFTYQIDGESYYAGSVIESGYDSVGLRYDVLKVGVCEDKGCPYILVLGGRNGGPVDGQIFGYRREVVENPNFDRNIPEDPYLNPRMLVRFIADN